MGTGDRVADVVDGFFLGLALRTAASQLSGVSWFGQNPEENHAQH
jgi:hypothetical protein